MSNKELSKRKQQLEKELQAIQLEEQKHEAYKQLDMYVKYVCQGDYSEATGTLRRSYEKNEKYLQDMRLKAERLERLKIARENRKKDSKNYNESTTENYEAQPQYSE